MWVCGCMVVKDKQGKARRVLPRKKQQHLIVSDFFHPSLTPATHRTPQRQVDGLLLPPLARQLGLFNAKQQQHHHHHHHQKQQHHHEQQQSRPRSIPSLHPLLGRRRHPSTSRRGGTARGHPSSSPSSSPSYSSSGRGSGICSASASSLCAQYQCSRKGRRGRRGRGRRRRRRRRHDETTTSVPAAVSAAAAAVYRRRAGRRRQGGWATDSPHFAPTTQPQRWYVLPTCLYALPPPLLSSLHPLTSFYPRSILPPHSGPQ